MEAGGLPQMVHRVRLGDIASRNGQPEDVVIGIVGDGFGALLIYTTAVYLGFRPEQIGIFGENTNPVADLPAVRLEPRADRAALRVGVALPAGRLADLRADSTPGRAAAWRRCSAPPGASSTPACRRSSPRRPWSDSELGYEKRVLGGVKIGWMVREPGPPAALLALRRGREPARALQARADRDRPRPAGASRASTARRARTRRRRTASCRPTSPRSTTRAAATSSSAPASRRSTSG